MSRRMLIMSQPLQLQLQERRREQLKKIVFSVLLIVLSSSLLFGALSPKNNENGIVLYGSMSSFSRLAVYPMQASGSGSTGMPFNILGNDITYVSYSVNEGRRQIATWTLSTNELQYYNGTESRLQPTLTIKADPLVSTETGTSTSLDYYLYFRIDPINRAELLDGTDIIEIPSNCLRVASSPVGYPADEFVLITPKSAINSVDQPIRFMLAQEYTSSQKDDWDYGSYSATVTLSLVSQ